MREISIRHGARMANRMLQLLSAHGLAAHAMAPDCAITGQDIPEWSLNGGRSGRGHRGWPKLDGSALDVDWLMARVGDGTITTLRVAESVCNVRLLPDRATANAVFDAGDQGHYPTTEGDLVIHVRLEDILEPGRNPGYGPLPLSWYRQLIADTGFRPVFVGQFGTDPYSKALKEAFPDAVILEGGSVLYDFQTIRNAHNVALGISTFSWLAAWLGTRGQIFLPVLGMLHPLQYPRIDLLPRDDLRFQFDLFEPRDWMADEAAMDAVIRGTTAPRRLARNDVTALCAEAKMLGAPDANAWRARMQATLDAG